MSFVKACVKAVLGLLKPGQPMSNFSAHYINLPQAATALRYSIEVWACPKLPDSRRAVNVKEKEAVRLQEPLGTGEKLREILFASEVIDNVTGGHDNVELPEALWQKPHIKAHQPDVLMPSELGFRNRQHMRGKVRGQNPQPCLSRMFTEIPCATT